MEREFESPQSEEELDARLLESIVIDNERFNRLGIPEADIEVVFWGSLRCDWGETFSITRFRRALKAMRTEVVVNVTGRWFPRMSPNAAAHRDATDEKGTRICARRGCKVEISEMRADAEFCSSGCRNRARRQHQAANYPVHHRRSEDTENGRNRESGPTDSPTRKHSENVTRSRPIQRKVA